MSLSVNPSLPIGHSLHPRLRRWSLYLVITICFVSIAVLSCYLWIDGDRVSKNLFLSDINLNTTVCFVLASFSFLLLAFGNLTAERKLIGFIVAISVLIIALIKLAEILFDIPIHIDQLSQKLFKREAQDTTTSMTLNTAINFVLLSLALLLLHLHNKYQQRIAQVLALFIGFVSLFLLIGYAYQLKAFSAYISMAFHTAICFFLFAVALLLYRPGKGLMKQLTSPFTGGLSGRIMIPLAIIIPILLGYIRLWLHRTMPNNVEMGIAILIISIVAVFVSVIWVSISMLNKHDGLRHTAEYQLQYVNKSLHSTNTELASANKELASLNEELLANNEQLNSASTIIKQQADVIVKQKEAQIEEKVEASEKRFRVLIENISDAIVLNDANANLVYQSPSVTRILGYSVEERIGKNAIDYVHQDHKQEFVKLYDRLKENPGMAFPFQHKAKHRRGHYVWLEGVVTNLLLEPSVKAYVENYQDITERKFVEEELKANQRNLDTLINNTKDLIWLIDKDLKLVLANKSFEALEFTSRNISMEIGGHILETATDDAKHKWRERYEKVLEGQQLIVEEDSVDEQGKNIFSEITLNPVYDEKHQVVGAGCFSRDITERKYIEQKLKYFIDQYDIVSRATNDAIWDWYLETDTIVWNHGLKTIFGYEEKDITYSRHWRSENVHLDDITAFQKEVEETFKNCRTNFSFTYRFRCSNGIYKYVFDRAYVIYENQKPVRMIGAIQDIDDRMGNLEEVKKLSLVASKTENAVVITDKNNRIEWINNSFTKLTDYKLKEVIGRRPYDFLQGPETNPEVISRIEEKLGKGESVSEELINYSKSGKKYFVKLDVTPIYNDFGHLEKFISIQSDITKQKEFERNITAIARELANLIEYANTPIFGIDRNGYINEWNKVAAELTGYGKDEVFGKKILEGLIEPSMWPILSEQLQKIFQGIAIANIELTIHTKNKERLIILLNGTPRRNSVSEIVGAFIVGQNITELIEYRQNLEKKVDERTKALNESLKKEKELVEMKNKFVSMVSHEFRTPLSSISLASGFIKKYQHKITKEEAETKLDNIEKQVRHMTFLLNDILTIGKSEAGKIQTQVTPLPLRTFLQNLVKDVEHSTGGTHKVNLEINCGVEIIHSDEKLLRNIIINLLTNAIKFSPQQRIVNLDVKCVGDNLHIKTQDRGMGISTEDLPNIFTAFHRGNNVGVVQGTGLGLSITKKAVDLLHGDIQVTSELGKGTTFTITLPINHNEENSVG